MPFRNDLRNLKVKLDYITLKVQLDIIMHILDKKKEC